MSVSVARATAVPEWFVARFSKGKPILFLIYVNYLLLSADDLKLHLNSVPPLSFSGADENSEYGRGADKFFYASSPLL